MLSKAVYLHPRRTSDLPVIYALLVHTRPQHSHTQHLAVLDATPLPFAVLAYGGTGHASPLTLRSAHRGPLHPGRYGRGLPVPPCAPLRERRSPAYAGSPVLPPARLKGRATRPLLHTRRVSRPLLTAARVPLELRAKAAFNQAALPGLWGDFRLAAA